MTDETQNIATMTPQLASQLSQLTVPDLAATNKDLDPDTESLLRNTNTPLTVTADVMHRLYCGLYLINQSFSEVATNPETPGMVELIIRTKLINELATQYPDFHDFDVEVSLDEKTERLKMLGLNDFTNSVLHALNMLMNSPISDQVNQTLLNLRLNGSLNDQYGAEYEDE